VSIGPVSVIVPARNEADTIEGCIRSILNDPAGPSLDVVVVCNACTDNTAETADRIAPNVRVIEISQGSKTLALNEGLRSTEGVRHYIDADVVVAPGTISATTAALEPSHVWAAAPPLRIEMAVLSPLVRAFVSQWLRASYFTERLIGAGYYALTPDGQEAVGDFPPLLNEDWYVSAAIPAIHRAEVEGCWFTPSLADNLSDLIKIETRHDHGRREFTAWAEDCGLPVPDQSRRPLRTLIRRPADLWSAPLFVGVRLITSVAGRRRAHASDGGWIPTR